MEGNATKYQRMQDRIVNGGFEPGARLKPEALAAEYQCSASAMREILLRLSADGLADFQEQRGFRVPLVSPERRSDLTRFRTLLESEGARLSIRRGGLTWEANLTAAQHKLGHIESRISSNADNLNPEIVAIWTAAELDFHRALIADCGSAALKKTHGIIYQQFRQQLIYTDIKFDFLEENTVQHRAILDAALAHDEEAVGEAIAAHLARNIETP